MSIKSFKSVIEIPIDRPVGAHSNHHDAVIAHQILSGFHLGTWIVSTRRDTVGEEHQQSVIGPGPLVIKHLLGVPQCTRCAVSVWVCWCEGIWAYSWSLNMGHQLNTFWCRHHNTTCHRVPWWHQTIHWIDPR